MLRLERLAEDAFDACLLLQVVEALGEDIRELGRRGDADEQHLAILDDLVGEVLLESGCQCAWLAPVRQ